MKTQTTNERIEKLAVDADAIVEFVYNGKSRSGRVIEVEKKKTGNTVVTLDLGAGSVPPAKSFIVEKIESDVHVVKAN